METDSVRVYRSIEHPCGYWPERRACNLLIDPDYPAPEKIYPTALAHGFRRSGNHLYRPNCPDCQACISVRIRLQAFAPNRSQRRNLRDNRALHTRLVPAIRTDEHFLLYRRYLQSRHADGSMAAHSPDDFDQFLCGDGYPARFMEIRMPPTEGSRLLALAVTDVLPDGLSAVYTFYDPEHAHRGLGTFAILKQIQWANTAALSYLYLGYWIKNHPKMDYKRRFRALQGYDGRHWYELNL